MDINILKEKVAIAKEAVEGLEDPTLKAEGFRTILSKLIDEDKKIKKTSQKAETIHNKSMPLLNNELPEINRTKYPQIHLLKKTLERSLFILKIYRDEKEIDGLTPSQIAKILTKTFRLKTKKEAVSMALMEAKNEVDRESFKLPSGHKAYKYKIMSEGEGLLKQKLEDES